MRGAILSLRGYYHFLFGMMRHPKQETGYEFLIYCLAGVFYYTMFRTLRCATLFQTRLFNVALLNRHGATARRF